MKKLPFLLPLFLLAIVLISGSTALSTTTAQDDCEVIYVRPDIVTVDLTGYPDCHATQSYTPGFQTTKGLPPTFLGSR
jgi:hypothetical protein